jgi:hypothetical protein
LVATSSDKKYVIQARQERYFAGAPVTVNTAISADVNGDRVGVYLKEPSFLLVNNAPKNELDIERRLPHGGNLQRHGGKVVVTWPDGGRLSVTRDVELLNYTFEPGLAAGPTLGGLLGTAGGISDRIASRDGSTLSIRDPDFANKLYKQVGNSWRIKQSESLFHYWPGESTDKFTDLTFPPQNLPSHASSERPKAESICRALGIRTEPLLDDCIFDVSVTGLPALAAASVGIHLATVYNSAAPASYGGSGPLAPSTPDFYTINIGDTVSPDHPYPGAGIIGKAGEKQSYSFSGQAGRSVYVKVGPCDGAAPSFDLRRSDDTSIGGKIGCVDFGPLALPESGTYRIIASADGPSAHYSFSLGSASFDQYSIKIGDTVSPDHPSSGAGIIAQSGQRQSYSFEAHAGQIIYFGSRDCKGFPWFDLFDPSNNLIGGRGGCGDFGPLTLHKAGTYRILAKANGSGARFIFALSSTTFDQYSIQIGDTVSPGHPSPGAGIIALPGERQSYSFHARAGQVIYFSADRCEGSLIGFDLLDPSNNVIGGRAGCGESTALRLTADGIYRMQVKAEGGTARYSFSVKSR